MASIALSPHLAASRGSSQGIPLVETPVNLTTPVLSKPLPILSLLTSKRGIQVIKDYVLSFLEPRELAAIESTNKAWRQAAEPCWKTQAAIHGMMLEVIPDGTSYRQIFKALYPDSITLQFYKKHWGDAGPLACIPLRFIAAANRPDASEFQLTFLPESITITVSKDSMLTLNENGRLIEEPTAAGKERQIAVPVDLKNMTILAEKCLKQGTPTGFHDEAGKHENPRGNVLNQHGDTRIESHWFYPRKEVIGLGQSFAEQQAIAANAGLEVTPLIDTAIYYLLRQISSGNSETDYIANTSTPTLCNRGISWPSSLWWRPSGLSVVRLYFSTYSFEDDSIGVAVGIPAASSQKLS